MSKQSTSVDGAVKAQPKGRIPKDPMWMSVLDITREFGISRQTVYSLCNSGRLPFYQTYNGRRQFRRDEVETAMLPYRKPATHPAVADPMDGYEGQIMEFNRGRSKQGERKRQYELAAEDAAE